MNGEFISSYSSFTDAIKNNDIIQNDLRHLHKGPWIAKGFIWTGDNNKFIRDWWEVIYYKIKFNCKSIKSVC